MSDPKRLAESGSEASEALRGLCERAATIFPRGGGWKGSRRDSVRYWAAQPWAHGRTRDPDPAWSGSPCARPSVTAGTASGGSAAAKALGVGAAVVALVGGAWLLTRTDPVAIVSPPAAQAPPVSRSEPAATPNEPTPSPAPRPSAVESAAPPAKAQAPEGARSHASAPSESALLAQAQAALRSNPQRALALTREHKRRFPTGALAQEREVIAIEALNRIGDGDAARKRAKEFETSYPGSAHRRKVQNATKP